MPADLALARSFVPSVSAAAGAPVALPVSPPALSQADQDHRREMLRRARHESIIEGGVHDRSTRYIDEALIRGDVDHDGAIAMLDQHYGISRAPK
jgi:Antitoxin VbhA